MSPATSARCFETYLHLLARKTKFHRFGKIELENLSRACTSLESDVSDILSREQRFRTQQFNSMENLVQSCLCFSQFLCAHTYICTYMYVRTYTYMLRASWFLVSRVKSSEVHPEVACIATGELVAVVATINTDSKKNGSSFYYSILRAAFSAFFPFDFSIRRVL